MKLHRSALLIFLFAVGGLCEVMAAPERSWVVTSPTHAQTFAYGSERNQQWMARDGHLALSIEFTNDPYVDGIEIRQYDDFIFDFPDIRLGADGHTFYYQTPDGESVPVATRHAGFLGIEEVALLRNSLLIIDKPHGYLSLRLWVVSRAFREVNAAG